MMFIRLLLVITALFSLTNCFGSKPEAKPVDATSSSFQRHQSYDSSRSSIETYRKQAIDFK